MSSAQLNYQSQNCQPKGWNRLRAIVPAYSPLDGLIQATPLRDATYLLTQPTR